jgi:hypothetical protein
MAGSTPRERSACSEDGTREVVVRLSSRTFLGLVSAAVALAAGAVPAAAHEDVAGVESSPTVTRPGAPPEDAAPSRWRGSILLFDQSMTTQTVGVGGDYQTYDPTYEWWVAFKPKYTPFERKNDSISLNLWMNFYLELTNSDTTTEYHELLIGPTYLWATYGRTLRDERGYKTSVAVGPRVNLPTDKAAYDTGQLIELGALGSVAQTFPLRGEDARALSGGRLAVGAIYGHPFDRTTAPVNGDLHQLRQDIAGLSVIDDQIAGQMNVENALSLSFSGEVQVLPRLNFSLSYVVINQWRYAPTSAQLPLDTGSAPVTSIPDPTTYTVKTWLTSSVAYDVNDELSVSLGYYNLANQLAPDGTRRSPFWSPSARFFLTLTANLDAVYRRVHGMLRPGAVGG